MNESVRFVVNGLEASCRRGLSLRDYMESAGLDPQKVVVEVNGKIMKLEAFGLYELNAGDQVEIIHFVGGG